MFCVFKTNKIHQLKHNKTDHKTHYLSDANSLHVSEQSQVAAVVTKGSSETPTVTNGTAGSNETPTVMNGTAGNNETHIATNGTAGRNETHAETESSGTPMHADEPKTGKNESHTETSGPKTGNNETVTVSNSTQSSNINQTTGNNETRTETNESKTGNNETVLSIFLVNDLQYDIFPVHPENGSMCDVDPGKYPSMGFDVQVAMRIKVRSLGM
jgi:hypothetical protein